MRDDRPRTRAQRADDADARSQARVGELFDLERLPDTVTPIGWLVPDALGRVEAFCAACLPEPPVTPHVGLYRHSLGATRACRACGRRLDDGSPR